MASNYASVKLSGDFVDQVRKEAEVVHRSVGAQVEYWARLGRAVENAPGVGIEKVRQALEGRFTLDGLSQAELNTALDGLGAYFDTPDAKAEAYYAELGAREGAVGRDEKGRLVRRLASGRVRPIA
ncbi:MAG: hypothetical protein JWQ29_1190 [Phenylobacterium sp.]|jgi:hypothetical protein|nr:hypothetical protein [Phenylobacterium sp.]